MTTDEDMENQLQSESGRCGYEEAFRGGGYPCHGGYLCIKWPSEVVRHNFCLLSRARVVWHGHVRHDAAGHAKQYRAFTVPFATPLVNLQGEHLAGP